MTIIMGNISKAAETRIVDVKGVKTMVTDFNVAENRGYGETQTTKFWRISVWRDRGSKLAPHLTVGRPIYIEGHASASAYVNNEGKAVAQLEMTNPSTIKLIGKKPSADGAEGVEGEAFQGDEV